MKNDCFSFIKFCNERIANSNDYNIARTIINHIEDIKILSLEKIAEEANISPASVSRFINKAGFESFQAFKYEFELFTRDVKMRRIISHTQRFMRTTIENMSESLYVDGLANLRQTKLNLDIDKLKEIVKLLKTSKSVTFIGDTHEMIDFYTVQLDLVANEVPAYLFDLQEFQDIHSDFFKDGDTLVLLNVSNDFYSEIQKRVVEKASQKNLKLVVFAQDDLAEQKIFDYIYQYGIPKSINDGYYSLFYLSQIISELIYKVRVIKKS
jgi:DNA-binding MurR/RpiR family transcriptional regulator